jgi:hypothetical protein
MAAADSNIQLESPTDRPEFASESLTLQAVVRQIRICRSTLGAVLDLLETAELDSDSLEAAAEGAMSVMAETEQLWNMMKEVG